jgi:nucleotide-binding universal stress UspA family protein
MFPWKKIICPTDFSDSSLEALTHATELAIHFKADLYLVHALPTHPEPTDWKEKEEGDVPGAERLLYSEAEGQLRKLTESLPEKGVRVHPMIVDGDAAEQIVRVAKDENADLIVIATHGASGWRHLAFGSVTEKVVRTATCLVLIARMGAGTAERPA